MSRESQQSIADWAEATFGPVTDPAVLDADEMAALADYLQRISAVLTDD